ncbi:bifunctional diguanylate cyclase/phosphodiesterase [Peribacillus acanthi]|uniref:sensor domain-containing protein n=1 Tax=Peribacillus acanthi TaxID=2171554 RepID=UPI000D3EC3EE|nr:bifunctional diguanylate cyclase/phosphodiesterase [Peribacillus acanthi]
MNRFKAFLKKEIRNAQNGKSIEKIIFDIIFYHVSDMLYIMKVEEGPKFLYVFANEKAFSVANISLDSMGKTIEDVISPKYARILQEQYEKVLKQGDHVTFSQSTLLDDGNILYGETLLTPIKEENGDIKFIVAITRDITASEIEKRNMIEAQQRFKSVIDHNMDAILSLNREGKITGSNPSSYSILGYSEKQLRNRSVYHLVHDQQNQRLNELINGTLEGYSLEMGDCLFIHKNGQELKTVLKTVPIVVDMEIRGLYIILRDITELSKNLETIEYLAYHDQLTGLLNRPALQKHLEQKILKAKETGSEIAILYIDLDRFKYLNDSLGHNKGDYILNLIGNRLLSLDVGKPHSVYRLGGDEFVVLIPNSSFNVVPDIAQKIFESISLPFELDYQDYFITPSIGISMYPLDGNDSETLIRKADGALYQVKTNGKAHFQFYSQEMNIHIPTVLTMETNLRRAIEKNELLLFFQPQILLETNEISGYEALLRWDNPVLGFVSPADFIPLAEDTGLIIPIGHWVLEETCKKIKEWQEKGVGNCKIAVNLSPKQFLQPSLPLTIGMLIEKYQIAPDLLEIEITEGAMQDTSKALNVLRELKTLGLTISVDDFGTGYSSLSYLKQFPLDKLKIDQSFIKEVLTDQKSEAIITTIIHLAHSLGLEVVAEGVETEEQANFLRLVKCEKAQGFLFSKPLPSQQIEEKYIYLG